MMVFEVRRGLRVALDQRRRSVLLEPLAEHALLDWSLWRRNRGSKQRREGSEGSERPIADDGCSLCACAAMALRTVGVVRRRRRVSRSCAWGGAKFGRSRRRRSAAPLDNPRSRMFVGSGVMNRIRAVERRSLVDRHTVVDGERPREHVTRLQWFERGLAVSAGLASGGIVAGGFASLAASSPSHGQDVNVLNFLLAFETLQLISTRGHHAMPPCMENGGDSRRRSAHTSVRTSRSYVERWASL
jgi:hypothetical protein